MNANPASPIEQLKGVGPKLRDTLGKLGIYNYLDLLLHLPFRYQDRTHSRRLSSLQHGEEAQAQGTITSSRIGYGKRRSLIVEVEDDSGAVQLRFFYFSKYQQQQLATGQNIRFYGEFRHVGKTLGCIHPDYELVEATADEAKEMRGTLTPVYPVTAGLTQGRLRALTSTLCNLKWPEVAGVSSQAMQILRDLHHPPSGTSQTQIEHWQSLLALDELCAYYLVMQGRARHRRAAVTQALPQADALGRRLLKQLGFRLTAAQSRVAQDILHDLAQTRPMLRLVQGDVGSGKTIIAAFAAIRAAEHGVQSALMAPTELLAEQHYLNFCQWLNPLAIEVVLLTGQLNAAERRERRRAIASGKAQVVIGTHALFQQDVDFANLGLSIIDEQHRFGVHQRMALMHKNALGQPPHQLVMTATPIPRTLTMALYADMDVSIIDELPPGRQPITTHTVNEQRRDEVIAQVASALARQQQVYWVCTLIEPSDELDAMPATTLYEQLQQTLATQRIALLHGRLSSDDKLVIMQQFKAGDIDLLVATTVIEVGVDVPNATLMVIENTERLGLAQLHQLRGRVGRGEQASECFLLFKSGLSEAAKARLKAMRDSQDGFYLAEQDLKIRGPGDVLGTRQAGERSFRIADLNRDAHLMPQVIERGQRLLQAAPDSEAHTELKQLLDIWAPADQGHLNV